MHQTREKHSKTSLRKLKRERKNDLKTKGPKNYFINKKFQELTGFTNIAGVIGQKILPQIKNQSLIWKQISLSIVVWQLVDCFRVLEE